MKTADFVVFDIETGGFLNKMEEVGICELAAIILDSDTLEEKARWDTIIAPHKLANGNLSTYTQGALDVNMLTMAKIEAGMEAKQAAKEFNDLCNAHKKPLKFGQGRLIPVGHNINDFDIPWVRYFMNLFNYNLDDIFNPFTIDTMWISRVCWAKDGCIVDHKLATSCKQAGINLIDGHRAMADVESNAELLKYFIQNMRCEGEGVKKEVENYRETFKFE